METIKKAMDRLNLTMREGDQHDPIPFETFLKLLSDQPTQVLRNVFQVFHDMISHYVGEGLDEYLDDPESIAYVHYDCTRLFVEDSDHPFFADRLFANRLINHIESLKRGAQQNKIYIFDGPPGCGKSTFLNNLLRRFETYANTESGMRYETVWRLDPKLLGCTGENGSSPLVQTLSTILENQDASPGDCRIEDPLEGPEPRSRLDLDQIYAPLIAGEQVEVPCPSHDHPILMIPKRYRRQLFDDLFENDELKWRLFTEKEYEWVFRDKPCTICSSLYQALLNRLKSFNEVFGMLYARPYRFNRRLGEGISVFNPGDRPMRQTILSNPMIQRRINSLLRDSNQVKYIFSRYAKTNNGIYALMDIKSHNIERLIELHNIISEGVHKVEDIEENVHSLFLALMNPEDKKNIQDIQSFSDRIEYIKIPYVLDLNTEVEIYRNIFGRHIEEAFLPRVLHNFARAIIASRLNIRSDALLEWIGDPSRYRLYCDENLQLLKMEIYTGYIPTWLSEEDRKRFTAKRRRKIIAESEFEGQKGFSGRDSIKIFNEFYSAYAREDRLINMSNIYTFFTVTRKDLGDGLPDGFLDSLVRLYDYTVLQEVKESLYYYNEEQISRDIRNYLFAVNFEPGAVETCRFTGEKLEITDAFFESIEHRLLGSDSDETRRRRFRGETQREYASRTLTQEMMLENKDITETVLYEALFERYVYNIKEKVLDPFLENENFRKAIKDYKEEDFKTYDRRIRDDVTFLINNLGTKSQYSELGAKEVCIYVIDNDLARKFS
jgi:predicted Ser/Thr protein kinase